MKRRLIIILVSGLLLLVFGVALGLIRAPQPGNVYRTNSDNYGLAEPTALLVRNGDCLTVSESPQDIGRRGDVGSGARDRLYIIAAGRSVVAGEDEQGLYLEDKKSGLRARPGDAIDGEIQLHPPTSLQRAWLKNSLARGWPIKRDCAHSLADVFSLQDVRSSITESVNTRRGPRRAKRPTSTPSGAGGAMAPMAQTLPKG